MATPIACPTCGKVSEFFADPIGPFCCGRCKMADLGRWLGEDYCISEELRPDHFSDELPTPRETEDREA